MAGSKQAIASLFDRLAPSYDRVGPGVFAHFGRGLVDAARVGEAHDLLDVGCGSGAVLAWATGRARQALGVDLSPGMVAVARSRGLDAEVMDVELLHLADESFDVVTAGFSLPFFTDGAAALAEIARVLRPGGLLAVSARGRPDPTWAWNRALLPDGDDPEPLATAEELVATLAPAGLAGVRVIEDRRELVFESAHEWWAWLWSHADRARLEALDAEALEAYRTATFEHLGAGEPRLMWTTLIATAVRP